MVVVVSDQGWKQDRHLVADAPVQLWREQLLVLLHVTLRQPLAASFHAMRERNQIDHGANQKAVREG